MLGFTKTEERVIVLLISTFILGAAIRIYQSRIAPLQKPGLKAQAVLLTEQESKEEDHPEAQHTSVKLVELNSATREDLIAIPGIGPVLADRIIQYREKQKGFSNLGQLKNVKGIGQIKYEDLKTVLTVHP